MNKKTKFKMLSFKTVFSLQLVISMVFVFSACENKDQKNFEVGFNLEMLDDNHVKFTNTSSGEYYSLIWDFGNGEGDTTTDKKKSYEVYYPVADNYNVTLTLIDYSGNSESNTQSVSITATDLQVSFTAEIDEEYPNIVHLSNTSTGEYESFKWIFNGNEVENIMEYDAYFPYAGSYLIKLILTSNNMDYSKEESITIAEDDPNNDPYLIWSEEFNYSGLPDPVNWNIETGGNGWGNNELQYYTNLQSNVMVEDGLLTITAREESYGGRDYTSARIMTLDKFDFQYGRIEARIKLPYGQGLWPAFWMMGSNINTVGWPECGEIDIMELVGGEGNDNTIYATLHWDNNGEHAEYGQSYTLPSGIFADDFHIFEVTWDSQQIKAFVDGNQYYVIDITPAQLSEFHQNFFIILNVAVGGNWPGPPNASTEFPQTMEVDYIRVYQGE